MKQSNTYLKTDISFGGILQPIVESLERNQRQPGKLVGQEVVIYTRDDVQAIIALDAGNNVHLLITPPSNGDPRLSRFELKGLKITDMEWSVAGRNSQLYLDISCATGTMPSFRRPFLRFAEDVLLEISHPERVPADAAYTTLDADEAASQTVLSVTSTSGFANSDNIGIELDDGTRQWTTISSFVADDTVTVPLGLCPPSLRYLGV